MDHPGDATLVSDDSILRSLFDLMPQLGWTARPDGHIDFYNRRWSSKTQATRTRTQDA